MVSLSLSLTSSRVSEDCILWKTPQSVPPLSTPDVSNPFGRIYFSQNFLYYFRLFLHKIQDGDGVSTKNSVLLRLSSTPRDEDKLRVRDLDLKQDLGRSTDDPTYVTKTSRVDRTMSGQDGERNWSTFDER